MDELSLRDYLEVVRRRWRLIAVVVVVIAALAFGVTTRQTPLYQATAEVQLDFDPTSLVDGGTRSLSSSRLVENELRFLTSTVMADAVEEELGREVEFSARNASDTDSMLLTVQGSDADEVAVAANAYAERYISLRQERNAQKYLATGQEIRAFVVELNSRIEVADDADEQARLERQRAFYQDELDTLGLAETVARESGVAAAIISPAEPPTSPFEPRPLRSTVLASIVGLILGVAVAFLLEYLDDTVKQKEDLERASGLPVTLALLPKADQTDGPRGLVSLERPNSGAAEAYRSLRTSIQFAGLRKHLGSLQLTSAEPGDGKTTTACNLAVVTALAGQQVVLIDCDLRSPRVHEHFGVAGNIGFTNVLLGEVTIDQALQPIDGVEGLYVIASGSIPPNPTELLGAMPMPEMVMTTPQVIEALTARGIFVIIDCPPVLPVADALVLSYVVDGTVFVASAGQTSAKHVGRALEQLRQVEANVVGTVLNNMKIGAAYGYGYGVDAELRASRWARLAPKRRNRPRAVSPVAAPLRRHASMPAAPTNTAASAAPRHAAMPATSAGLAAAQVDSPTSWAGGGPPEEMAGVDPRLVSRELFPNEVAGGSRPLVTHNADHPVVRAQREPWPFDTYSADDLPPTPDESASAPDEHAHVPQVQPASNEQHRLSSLSREASGRRRGHRSHAGATNASRPHGIRRRVDPPSPDLDGSAPIVSASRHPGVQSDVALELGDGIIVNVNTFEHN